MSEERLNEIGRKIKDMNILKSVNETIGYYDYMIQNLYEYTKQLKYKLEQKDKAIEEAINKLQLLINIGFDYDGFNQVESLKTLIDELVGYAKESRDILSKYKGETNE